MSKLEEQLVLLGLTNTEAQLYLAGLTHKGTGAHELAKETAIKRPTVYHALETLIQKGLVSKKGTGARRVFHMTSPEHIGHLLDTQIAGLEEQKKGLEILIPFLNARVGDVSSDHIEVTQYEGIGGVKIVVEEALYCKSRHWEIIAPSKNFWVSTEFSG